jgi:hypothetical protein
MNSPIVPKIVCQRCRAALDAEDNYCRRCGTPTANLAGASGGAGAAFFGAGPANSSRQRSAWWDHPWFVVAMLFLVIGPLALPMLWRSHRFTQGWKIVLTVLVTILTVWLCSRVWIAMQQTVATLDELQKQL